MAKKLSSVTTKTLKGILAVVTAFALTFDVSAAIALANDLETLEAGEGVEVTAPLTESESTEQEQVAPETTPVDADPADDEATTETEMSLLSTPEPLAVEKKDFPAAGDVVNNKQGSYHSFTSWDETKHYLSWKFTYINNDDPNRANGPFRLTVSSTVGLKYKSGETVFDWCKADCSDESAKTTEVVFEGINGKRISSIPANTLQGFSNVKSIKLDSACLTDDVLTRNGSGYNTILEKVVINNDNTSRDYDQTICASAFSKCSNLKTVQIKGAGLQKLEANAFAECTNLKTVSICSTKVASDDTMALTIVDSAFNGCTNLTNLNLDGTVRLDSKALQAFKGCSGLTSITIPASVTEIGSSTFRAFTNLKAVTFASGGNCGIYNYVFDNCTNLETVTFEPDSHLSRIGTRAFYGCTNLSNINLPAGTKYSVYDKAFMDCTSLTAIVIPDGVDFQGSEHNQFASCNNLVEVKLPKDITIIPQCVFTSCTKLTTVNFEELTELTEIQNSAFYDTALTKVDLSKTKLQIFKGSCGGDGAFVDCNSLELVILPATLKTLHNGSSAFRHCENLKELVFLGEEPPTITKDCGYNHYLGDIFGTAQCSSIPNDFKKKLVDNLIISVPAGEGVIDKYKQAIANKRVGSDGKELAEWQVDLKFVSGEENGHHWGD